MKTMFVRKWWFCCILLCFLVRFNSPVFALGRRIARKRQILRVVIAELKSIPLEFSSRYTVFDSQGGRKIRKNKKGALVLYANPPGLMDDDGRLLPHTIFIDTGRANQFRCANKIYRGNIELLLNDHTIIAVNYIPLETYLKSVISSEIPKGWRLEALKAQAVAARGFAYYHMVVNKDRKYDLNLNLQQYHGIDSENPKTVWAVDVTFGQVLFFKGKIFPTYFHAVCGGYTEDASAVWKTNIDLPAPVRSTYCKGSHYFNWKYSCTKKQLARMVRLQGYKCNTIYSIKPGKKSRYSPRLRSIIISADGHNKEIPINIFRRIVGYSAIRSGIFTIKQNGNTLRFVGQGWGHGVGLCQYCAKAMADKGINYKQILYHFYPKTKLKRAY